MHQMQGTLTPTAPFDFNKSLEFLGLFRPAMGEERTEDGVLTKGVSVNGQVVVLRVPANGTIDAPELAYALYSDEAFVEELHQTMPDRINFFLSLDDDLRPFYAIGEEDPAFEPVIQDLYGYHRLRFGISSKRIEQMIAPTIFVPPPCAAGRG